MTEAVASLVADVCESHGLEGRMWHDGGSRNVGDFGLGFGGIEESGSWYLSQIWNVLN